LLASTPAFGVLLEVEVRDLPRDAARDAIQAAGAEVAEVERLTDPGRPDGELASLNAAAGKGPRHVDARLYAGLEKALNFCLWSEGKEGPLARDLYRLWGRGTGAPLAAPPAGDLLDKAVEAASCRHLLLDGRQHTASLAAGAALDLVDFRLGMAVDRAIDVLRQHGAANAFVKIGPLRRGIGGGRAGHGWQVDLPALGGLREPLGRIFLRDQALALAEIAEQPLRVGDAALSPYIDQRSGQPSDGVFATLAATELATDAQALAATMAVVGTREGEMLMGSIRPRPSILWLMGSGSGIPLLVEYRWSDLPKR
jgi:thiamine biosynthesis lipoprotein